MIRFVIRRRYGDPEYPWDLVRVDDGALPVVEESLGYHLTFEAAMAMAPADAPLAIEMQVR